MKPDELCREMCPGGINASLGLEVREIPAIGDFVAVVRHSSTSLRKARMGEDEDGHPVGLQNAVESGHSTPKVRSIHEHIVRNHEVKVLVLEGMQFAAGIHAKVHLGMLCTGDGDHALGEVNARNTSAVVPE